MEIENRSMPRGDVIPVLAYRGVRAAVDWLCRVFGFVERLRIGDHRAQLRVGGGAVVVAARPGGAAPVGGSRMDGATHSVMVRVADVDAHHAHALHSGATILSAPETHPYGERQYTVEDLGGHRWTFTQTVEDVVPALWGGVTTVTNETHTPTTADRELVLTRMIPAPREKVFRAWTEPELLKQWFAPLPWTTPVAETDVRPGGASLIVMRSPEGDEFPNRGVYLEVVENERLVFTDAYAEAWAPSEKPFMTVILTFEDEGGATRYTARVRHWSVADREAHEMMGFYKGWGQCADQLAEVVSRI